MRDDLSSYTIPRGREAEGAFVDDADCVGVLEPPALPARFAFSFGPFHVLAAQRLLLKDDTPVRLGSRALEILIALVERPAELLTKRELRARAWPDTVVDDGNLKVQIAALRRALGDGRGGNRYLVTISGRGYRFVAPVTRTQESAILSALRAPEPAGDAGDDSPARITQLVGRVEVIAHVAATLPQQHLLALVERTKVDKTAIADLASFGGPKRLLVLLDDCSLSSDPPQERDTLLKQPPRRSSRGRHLVRS